MDTLVEDLIKAEHPTEEFRSIWTDLRGVAFQQGWMDVDGCNIRYLRSGPADGPKVVLLAGTGGHAETFAANLGALGQQFDCWAIDIPGCGYSDKPDGSYDAINTAKFIKRWADVVGADQIDVVGVSVGSWSALQCAKQYPDLVKHLVLVSPAGGPLPEPGDPWYELWHMKDLRKALGTSGGEARKEIAEAPSWKAAEEILVDLFHDRERIPDDMIAARLDVNRQPGVLAAWDNINWWLDYDARMANTLTRDDLRAMRIPVLGVCEHEDRMLPIARAMFECLPDSRLVRIEGVGHWPHYEAPGQFNELTLDLLNR